LRMSSACCAPRTGWSGQAEQLRAAMRRPRDAKAAANASRRSRGFLGRREFALMKPTAFLVNTGRGALVEREALLDALTRGRIAGAGLDVFHEEPLKADDPLLRLPNVVLSPHNAGQTPEVLRDGLLRAVENVAGFLRGEPTDVVVAPLKRGR